MNEKYHSVCMDLGSITQLTANDAPFFIARPVEESVTSHTKTLLDLCQELLKKTSEQDKQIVILQNEVARLASKLQALEARANHLQWVNNRDYREESPLTITYGTDTVRRDSDRPQTTGAMLLETGEMILPRAVVTNISGSSDGPTTITTVAPNPLYDRERVIRHFEVPPSMIGASISNESGAAQTARILQRYREEEIQRREVAGTFGGMPVFVDPNARDISIVSRSQDFRVGMELARRFPDGNWSVNLPDGSQISAEDYRDNS